MNVLSKKAFYALIAVVTLLIIFDASGVSEAFAASDSTAGKVKSEAAIQLPAGSVNPNKVYFADYGQFVANPLLHFWRLNGRFDIFGGPISHTEMDKEGHAVQYFQKMALAYYPELANTAWETRPYQIGRLFLDAQVEVIRQSVPFGRIAPLANTQNQKYFPESGHSLSNGFLELYNKTGALFMWGFPLSEEYQTTAYDGKNYRAQLFERGRMLWSSETGSIIDPNFGTEMSMFLHANTSVDINPEPAPGQDKIPNYDSWVWEHWVDVNLSIQSETFYEGDLPVRTSLVTTGKPGHETPTGDFYIWNRIYNEHMKGGSIGADDFYDLYNVLYTQYFTYEGHALHYAWWRSQFGVTGSHGCVNEDLETSAFAWNYLNIGSRVHVHY